MDTRIYDFSSFFEKGENAPDPLFSHIIRGSGHEKSDDKSRTNQCKIDAGKSGAQKMNSNQSPNRSQNQSKIKKGPKHDIPKSMRNLVQKLDFLTSRFLLPCRKTSTKNKKQQEGTHQVGEPPRTKSNTPGSLRPGADFLGGPGGISGAGLWLWSSAKIYMSQFNTLCPGGGGLKREARISPGLLWLMVRQGTRNERKG